MNVFTALKLIQIDHHGLDPHNVIITDDTGKPDNVLTGLLTDVLTNVNLFTDWNAENSAPGLVERLHNCTPLPSDVLDEYRKILEQEIAGINFSVRRGTVELVYKPLI
ncbi:hypothetical protein [Lacticaseibacillus songhuajiangensis]|jgi:hypothetical protein|uniref:hypothetical protein n=1 Tax=Lacticaseibacillus songhuajiangensis TaxID=1296539 RepID=UPI000F7A706A|nr:hypothetical protein [Lacticaseibacillus songhuajiangensis]